MPGRGNSPSFMPSRQTTRNGIERCGTSPQKVTPPSRKAWRSGTASSAPRSASRTTLHGNAAWASASAAWLARPAASRRRASSAFCSVSSRGSARNSASIRSSSHSLHAASGRALAKTWRAWRSSPSRRSNWPSASTALPATPCSGRMPSSSSPSASWPAISPAYMRSKPNCHEFVSTAAAPASAFIAASRPHATRARRSQRSSASRPAASIAKRRATAGTSRKSSTSLTVKRLSARSSTCANALISGCARASPTSARCQGMCNGSLRYCAGSPNTAAR